MRCESVGLEFVVFCVCEEVLFTLFLLGCDLSCLISQPYSYLKLFLRKTRRIVEQLSKACLFIPRYYYTSRLV